MCRFIFAILIIVHGLIHLMVFSKSYRYGNIIQFSEETAKVIKALCLINTLIFIIAAILFSLQNENWPVIAVIAVVFSQLLFLLVWKKAKIGIAINAVIFLMAAANLSIQYFELQFNKDVNEQFRHQPEIHDGIVTEKELRLLPEPVRKYLRLSGVVNKPKVKNMKIVFEGKMRAKGGDWFPFQSVQYNFFDNPARLFFMKAKMYGTTIPGYHNYQKATAKMEVKLFGLFPLIEAHGIVLNMSETVTVFNDMCLMAPATLIDKRIRWKTIDSTKAKAIFTNEGFEIAAILQFNPKGELINFISDNRYEINEMKQYRFSTPVKNYKQIHTVSVPTYGEAIWDYPEGKYCYGQFNLKSIDYNVDHFEK